MNIEIERPVLKFGLDIWFWQRVGESVEVLRFADGRWDWERSDQAARGEPSLHLPDDVAALLGPALMEVAPPNVSQANHLTDAIEVRDRLLVLVETLWNVR